MYRSLLIVDLSSPSMRQALGNCQDMHRNIMKAFPRDNADRKKSQVLYRLMTVESRPALFVLSRELPNWDNVAGISLYQQLPPRLLGELGDTFKGGRVLRFSLLTSPCKKISGEGKNSRRVFLRTSEERLAWLSRKAKQNGFTLLQVSESAMETLYGKKEGEEIRYRTIAFDGMLRITDPDLFLNAYTTGIGPGKAYGLGMLMLAGCN